MSKRTKYCGIYACVNNQGTSSLDQPFFALPSEAMPTLRRKWIDAIKELYGVDFKSGRICGLHFHSKDYYMRYSNGSQTKEYALRFGAIPSVPLQLIKEFKTEDPESVELYSDASQESAFKFVDIESIKNGGRTIANVETYQPTHALIPDMEMSFESKFNVCHQCNEWERKYERMLERCNELSQENENLKLQLLNNTTDIHPNVNSFENATPTANLTTIDETENETKQEYAEPSNLYIDDDENSCVDPAVNADTPPIANKIRNVYRCNKCKAWFRKGEKLILHMKTHSKQFKFPTEYRHSKYDDFECYLCKVKIQTEKQMRKHLNKHVTARNKKCFVCNECLTPKEYKEHLCYGEKTCSCEYCNISFNSMSKLLQHLNIHSDRTMRRCRKCPRLFAMQQLIVWHEKQHEVEEPRPFVCNICSKSFREYNIMKSHLKTHQTADFLCSECGKGFKDEKALRYHNLSHGDKLLKCPDCPFTCKRKQSLKYHSDVHKTVTYKCPKCDAEFSTRRGLYKHNSLRHRVGGIEKKHQCTFCSTKFHDSDKLVTHLRKHTNEKPFICEICPDKKYKYKGDLNKHMRTHLGENMYQCKLCDEGFRTDWQLNRHSFVHYKEEKSMQMDSQ